MTKRCTIKVGFDSDSDNSKPFVSVYIPLCLAMDSQIYDLARSDEIYPTLFVFFMD